MAIQNCELNVQAGDRCENTDCLRAACESCENGHVCPCLRCSKLS